MRLFTEKIGPNEASITCYLQENSFEMPNIEKRPGILIFPGGGYTMCSAREADPIALAYMSYGYHAFVVNYTVGRGEVFDQALADAKAAMAYLQEKADEFCLEADKIAAVGFSAGGHLAACLATMTDSKPSALVLGYPCILENMGPPLGKTLPGADKYVTPQTPPTFLVAAQGDVVVPIENTLRFAEVLNQNSVPFEVHISLVGEHGFSLAQSHTCAGKPEHVEAGIAEWLPSSVRFLRQFWGNFDTGGQAKPFYMAKTPAEQPLRKLFANPEAAALIEAALPVLAQPEMRERILGLSLRRLDAYTKGRFISAEALAELEEKLNALTL